MPYIMLVEKYMNKNVNEKRKFKRYYVCMPIHIEGVENSHSVMVDISRGGFRVLFSKENDIQLRQTYGLTILSSPLTDFLPIQVSVTPVWQQGAFDNPEFGFSVNAPEKNKFFNQYITKIEKMYSTEKKFEKLC